jgi:hypothetical protein
MCCIYLIGLENLWKDPEIPGCSMQPEKLMISKALILKQSKIQLFLLCMAQAIQATKHGLWAIQAA